MGRGAKPSSGEVRDLTQGGLGVVALEDGHWYEVPGALPGDQVSFVPTKRSQGKLLKVLRPGPERVDPPCRHVAACGGCPLMSLAPDAQRRFKLQWVERAVGREATWHDGAHLGSRVRARLGFETEGGRRIGYRRRKQRDLLAPDRCVILAAPLQGALEWLREELLPLLQGQGELSLALGEGRRPVLRVESASPQPEGVYTRLSGRIENGALAGASVLVGGATQPAVLGDPDPRLVTGAGGMLRLPSGGFSQARDDLNPRLQELVLQGCLGDRPEAKPLQVLELYAGAGNFSIPLAKAGASVVAVEQDPGLVAYGRRNEAAVRTGGAFAGQVVFSEGDAALLPKSLLRKLQDGAFSVLLLDPPRAGALEALKALPLHAVSTVVMVSCNPATLAKDMGFLRDAGFSVEEAHAVDMFPHTAHVESVVRLGRPVL